MFAIFASEIEAEVDDQRVRRAHFKLAPGGFPARDQYEGQKCLPRKTKVDPPNFLVPEVAPFEGQGDAVSEVSVKDTRAPTLVGEHVGPA